MSPKVSIILTTHGEAPYLKQAIGSVLAQTFEDWELLIIWDGGDSWNKCVVWQDVDSRISCMVGPLVNSRLALECRFAANINRMFKEARGEFITYLCHDDLYLPWRLEMMVEYLERRNPITKDKWPEWPSVPKMDIVFGWQHLLNETPMDRTANYGSIRKGSPDQPAGTVDHSSVMHRRECFEKAGGWDENAPMRFGDAYFWLRLQNAGYKFHCIPEVLDVHRFNPHSVTWKIDHPEAQETDPHASHYFPPYDDLGNRRTIKNAVDAGWSAIEK